MSLKGSLTTCYLNDKVFYVKYPHGNTDEKALRGPENSMRDSNGSERMLKSSSSGLAKNKENVFKKSNDNSTLNNVGAKNISLISSPLSAISVECVTDFDCFPWKGTAAISKNKKLLVNTSNVKLSDVESKHFVRQHTFTIGQCSVNEKNKNITDIKKSKEIKHINSAVSIEPLDWSKETKHINSAVSIEPLNQSEIEHIRLKCVKIEDKESRIVSESSTGKVTNNADTSLHNSSVNILTPESSNTLLTCDPSNNDNIESLSEDNTSVFKFSKSGEMKWLEWCISKLKQEFCELENLSKEHELKVETNLRKREAEIKNKIREEENRLLWLEAKKKEDHIKKMKKKELEEKENQQKLYKMKKQSDIQKAYQKWLAQKNSQRKDKLQQEEKVREIKELEKSKRLEENRKIFEKWLRNSKKKVKPESGAIVINQVDDFGNSSAHVLFENPNPWQSTLDVGNRSTKFN